MDHRVPHVPPVRHKAGPEPHPNAYDFLTEHYSDLSAPQLRRERKRLQRDLYEAQDHLAAVVATGERGHEFRDAKYNVQGTAEFIRAVDHELERRKIETSLHNNRQRQIHGEIRMSRRLADPAALNHDPAGPQVSRPLLEDIVNYRIRPFLGTPREAPFDGTIGRGRGKRRR